MELVISVVTGALGAAFLASSLRKIQYWRISREWVGQLLPKGIQAGGTLAAVVSSEFLLVVLLLSMPRWGAVAALAWLAAATGILVVAQVRGIDCGCFGQPKRISSITFIRNGTLVVGAVTVFMLGADPLAAGAIPLAYAIVALVPGALALHSFRHLVARETS